ncbi:DUF1461 domain-containing protein [Candidatus Woesearchaeota archaeon]|nr:DUF1461 domain-containing protein [Candidatus Woesearchaeota archaeon]
MKINKFIFIVSVISLFFVLFFFSVFYTIYNLPFYEYEYEKYDIYSLFGKEKTISVTRNLFNYFKNKEYLDNVFFNEEEISHLYDVKVLINKFYVFYLFNLILFISSLFIVYRLKKKRFVKNIAKILVYTGLFSVLLIISVFIFYKVTGFYFLFEKFHEILFTGNYSFDPGVSNMKAMFPDGFFMDMSFRIGFIFVLESMIVLLTGIILKRKTG